MNEFGHYDGHAGRCAQHYVLITLATILPGLSLHAEDGGESPALEVQRDTLVIHAHVARQSDDRDSFSLRGDLELRGAEWVIHADSASVDGRLEDPDQIIVDGNPATISVLRDGDTRPFSGSSRHLEFDPRNEIVRLHGDAKVMRGEQSISSDSIRYLLQRDTFSAGTTARVKVVTKPKQD